MRRVTILTIACLACGIAGYAQEPLYDHIIFANSRMPGYNFFSATSYQSPSWIRNNRQKITNNWCAEIYMGLNQAPLTVMTENHRSGLIWKLLAGDNDMQQELQKIKTKPSP